MNQQPVDDLPPPDIIVETDRFLAICKPGGLLTQAPSGIDSVEVRIKRYLAKQGRVSGAVYLGVPHRLDRPASGAMVFAKDKKTARFLAEQFQRRQVRKIYWALVSGRPNFRNERWTDWMRKVPGEARSEICQESDQGAQSASLTLDDIGPLIGPDLDQRCSLLEIHLETGRSHQIRLQSSSRGFSILGDELYGNKTQFGPQTTDLRGRWIALHARELEFIDPATKQPRTITAPVPSHWKPFQLRPGELKDKRDQR